MSLGYSHPIVYTFPDQVKVTVEENTKITIEGPDRQVVGQVASELRSFYPPEPYKGKGVRYAASASSARKARPSSNNFLIYWLTAKSVTKHDENRKETKLAQRAAGASVESQRHQGTPAHERVLHQEEHSRAVHR
jgi:hypothetical protein